MALKRFPTGRNERITWLCDNKTAVSDVNKMTPKGEDGKIREKLLDVIRTYEAHTGNRVQSQWLPGAIATLADDGSRSACLKKTRRKKPIDLPIFIGWPIHDTMLVSEYWRPYLESFSRRRWKLISENGLRSGHSGVVPSDRDSISLVISIGTVHIRSKHMIRVT